MISLRRSIPPLTAAAVVLAACAGVNTDQAEYVLTRYLASLHDGYYDDAAILYGGPYDALQDDNPDVDPTDSAALLGRWCEQNGGVCLPIQTVVSREAAGGETYSFVVQLANDDGSTFEIGPCCGAEDTGQRTREFTFTVKSIGGRFYVMELPPYVP
ncbi:MAG TPA: hypothetical protein VLD63_13995 [Anaerolineales bacterium]|nr:hypothetical protein [Anaerolineales bacterium]